MDFGAVYVETEQKNPFAIGAWEHESLSHTVERRTDALNRASEH